MSDESVLREDWRAGEGSEASLPTLYREQDVGERLRCLSLWWPLEGESRADALARRDVAALAPRMARLLRNLEGEGHKRWSPERCCPECESSAPTVPHDPTCELGAVLAELFRIESLASSATPVVASKRVDGLTASLWVISTEEKGGEVRFLLRSHSWVAGVHTLDAWTFVSGSLEEVRGEVEEHCPSLVRFEPRADDHSWIVEGWGEPADVRLLTERRTLIGRVE